MESPRKESSSPKQTQAETQPARGLSVPAPPPGGQLSRLVNAYVTAIGKYLEHHPCEDLKFIKAAFQITEKAMW